MLRRQQSPQGCKVQVGTLSVSDQAQKPKQMSILPTATIVLKDKVGIDCNELKEHDRKVLEDFESTIVYSEMEKQYVVALPWKSNKSRLPSNFGMALGRVKQQCAKFQKDEAYLNHYQKILKDQEDRGFIERVDKNNVVEDCHYLAHHSVQKDSVTTPIRIVFDCSWRQGKNGLSLNDCLWTGPHITTDLLKVLLQFRTNNWPVLVI
ncbi:uncharacterized protein [Palaemon carinicauda]|uniref:uncharacterized protein n=1 Tax=Palaemon carinicauda TaxID=392227 RepID=UPI0035B5B12C